MSYGKIMKHAVCKGMRKALMLLGCLVVLTGSVACAGETSSDSRVERERGDEDENVWTEDDREEDRKSEKESEREEDLFFEDDAAPEPTIVLQETLPPSPTPTPTNAPTPTLTPHIHSYGEEMTTEATCETDGVKTYTCDCGDTYTETLKAFGHNYETAENSEVAATCTTDGKRADTKCSACGVQITGEVIPATGHQYGDYVYNNDATYTADGTKSAACTLCNDKKTVTAEGTKLTYTYTDVNATKFAKSNVNVRALPDTDGEMLGSLSTGDMVTVTGKCNETGWYRIEFEGFAGYVSSNYLVDINPEKGPDFHIGEIEYLGEKTVYATENSIIWDIDGNPIGYLMKNERITQLGIISIENSQGTYTIVEYNGQEAYAEDNFTTRIPHIDPNGYDVGTEEWHEYWDGTTIHDWLQIVGGYIPFTKSVNSKGECHNYYIPGDYIIGSYVTITYDDGVVIEWPY